MIGLFLPNEMGDSLNKLYGDNMILGNFFFLLIGFLLAFQHLYTDSFLKEFNERGYVEIFDKECKTVLFDSLYLYFDNFINFLQKNPVWENKLYVAKERFIRSKDRNYYSTDVFGFYDESKREGRSQISFYYSTHFHEFICFFYPEFNQVPEIMRFFEACFDIQKPCGNLFNEVISELDLKTVVSSKCDHPPILLKVIKYLPSYIPSRPHYDGSLFTLFLDSTNSSALLLSPYKTSFEIDDFSSPIRGCFNSNDQKSMILIPGTFLTEFSIYPTPHIVVQSGKVRYSTIAFAMRSNNAPQKIEFSPLPHFKH